MLLKILLQPNFVASICSLNHDITLALGIRSVKEVNYIDFFKKIIAIVVRNITKDFNISFKGGEEEALFCTWCVFKHRETATSITPLISF